MVVFSMRMIGAMEIWEEGFDSCVHCNLAIIEGSNRNLDYMVDLEDVLTFTFIAYLATIIGSNQNLDGTRVLEFRLENGHGSNLGSQPHEALYQKKMAAIMMHTSQILNYIENTKGL